MINDFKYELRKFDNNNSMSIEQQRRTKENLLVSASLSLPIEIVEFHMKTPKCVNDEQKYKEVRHV